MKNSDGSTKKKHKSNLYSSSVVLLENKYEEIGCCIPAVSLASLEFEWCPFLGLEYFDRPLIKINATTPCERKYSKIYKSFCLSSYFYEMNLILFDVPSYKDRLFPLTLTRPIAEIRVGILTLTQKWERYFHASASFLTSNYLAAKYPLNTSDDNLWVNGALCPDKNAMRFISGLKKNSSLTKGGTVLAVRNNKATYSNQEGISQIEYPHEITLIDSPWKIFQHNGAQIKSDYALVTKARDSATLKDTHTHVYGTVGQDIFIEQGALIKAATLNAEEGPIYLGKNSQVQEGSLIRGPFALCEGSHISMGAKIRGDSTIGPYSKVGGEISNSVILGYTNKAHDGFLGNSIIGEWCNLGAGTNTSNLKNNYGDIKIWDYAKKNFSNTGLQFCGLIMGDYSKCSVNTMFNTGTIVGIGCNIFGSGFPPKFIPPFAWGGSNGFVTHRLDSMLDTTEKVMARRAKKLKKEEQDMLEYLFDNQRENP